MAIHKFPLLLALEIPDCKCSVKKVRTCTLFYSQGCPDIKRIGHCEHAEWVKPCEHVWHADDLFYETAWAIPFLEDEDDFDGLLQAWIERLWAADLEDYYTPRKPTAEEEDSVPVYHKAIIAIEEKARVDIMAERQRHGLHIWHDGDLPLGCLGRTGILARNYSNGTVYDAGVSTYDPQADEELEASNRHPGKKYAHNLPWWGDFEEEWLNKVKDRINKREPLLERAS